MRAFVLAISLVLAGCTSGAESSITAESVRWERFNADLRGAVVNGCYPERVLFLISEYERDRAKLVSGTRESRDLETLCTVFVTLVVGVVGAFVFGRSGRG